MYFSMFAKVNDHSLDDSGGTERKKRGWFSLEMLLLKRALFKLLDFAPAPEAMFFLKRRYLKLLDFAPAQEFLLVRTCVL